MLRSLLFIGLASGSLWAADPDGAALYKARCATCHENATQARVPKREEIAALTPESIVTTMFAGAMVMQSVGLSQEEGTVRYLTGKEFRTAAAPMAGQCTTPAPKLSIAATDWNGWGAESGNSRYQPAPGLAAGDLPKLKLKWAFGFPGDSTTYGQPTIVGGRLFVGSASGAVYSLNAGTGCIYWTYQAGAGVRTAITIAPAKTGGRYVAYFGDGRASAHAVNAETGKPLWKTKVDDFPVARITGAPVIYQGRLYVPVSSIEEASAMAATYECCKFRGSLVALDADTGRQVWKSYTVLDPAKAFKKNKAGGQLFGPAGAAIWSSPTIDAKRKLVYVSTGDSYTDQDIDTSDALIAYDLETGKLAWVSQLETNDNFVMGCPTGVNCPDSKGPDFDFGTSAVFRNIGGGKQILVMGQKSGIVWGLDPDQKGKVVWQTRLGVGSALGGVEWGHAVDDQNVYAAISDRVVREGGKPGISAIRLATGEQVWTTPAPKVTCAVPAGCLPGQSAAVSVIPGAVFSGALNGHFRAYSTASGEILWDVDTAQPFETINNVPGAHGGSIDSSGPAIANGMVYTYSGYPVFGGKPGNVLLAFSVDGK